MCLCFKCGSGDRASCSLKPTLVDDLLDVLWRSYDGVDHVVVDGVRETMLDSAKSDHPLAAMGGVAQAPGDVVADLHLHSGLAEIDVAAILQFKVHDVLHDPVKPLPRKVGQSEDVRYPYLERPSLCVQPHGLSPGSLES
jgi:hypothetical protein